MLDDFDDLSGDTLADRLRLVRRPFKLAVELTGGGQNGQFATAPSTGLVPQITIERPGIPRELGTVQQDTSGASQTPDRPAFGVGKAVIGTLPCIIQLLAPRQWQPATGHLIDIFRIHGSLQSSGRWRLWLRWTFFRPLPLKYHGMGHVLTFSMY